jgi:hypothetical protein
MRASGGLQPVLNRTPQGLARRAIPALWTGGGFLMIVSAAHLVARISDQRRATRAPDESPTVAATAS